MAEEEEEGTNEAGTGVHASRISRYTPYTDTYTHTPLRRRKREDSERGERDYMSLSSHTASSRGIGAMECFLSGVVAPFSIKGAAAGARRRKSNIFGSFSWSVFSTGTVAGRNQCERAGDREEKGGNLRGVLPPYLCVRCACGAFFPNRRRRKKEKSRRKRREESRRDIVAQASEQANGCHIFFHQYCCHIFLKLNQ